MKKTKTITLNEQEYTIKKIPVGKFAQLMLAVDKLPSIVMNTLEGEDLQNMNQQQLMMKVPRLLASSQDEIFNLVSVASGVEAKEMADFDIEEFIQLIEAIIEVNNVSAIVERVQGLGKTVQAQKK